MFQLAVLLLGMLEGKGRAAQNTAGQTRAKAPSTSWLPAHGLATHLHLQPQKGYAPQPHLYKEAKEMAVSGASSTLATLPHTRVCELLSNVSAHQSRKGLCEAARAVHGHVLRLPMVPHRQLSDIPQVCASPGATHRHPLASISVSEAPQGLTVGADAMQAAVGRATVQDVTGWTSPEGPSAAALPLHTGPMATAVRGLTAGLVDAHNGRDVPRAAPHAVKGAGERRVP